jgi:hypothetical protein
MNAGVDQSSRTRRNKPGPSVPPWVQWSSIMVLAVLGFLLATIWLVNLERQLPDIRTPRDAGSSSVLEGHALMMPGNSDIQSVDAQLTGDWVTQEIGDQDWLATDLEGSRLRAAFYGTDIYLMARFGPDATRAYVTVNGAPVDHLSQDEFGSYVNLWSGETSDRPILLARNLAHGEHVVEIIAGSDGELAVAGFEAVATTPFQWAFLLAYAGIAGGLFMAVRSILYSVNKHSGATRSPRNHAPLESEN